MRSSALGAPATSLVDHGAGLEFWRGVRDLAPLLLGVAPTGLLFGMVARSSGISAGTALAMSALVFAGAAQLVLVQLLAGGALAVVLVASVALVNLRHVLYSASLAPHLAHLPLRWRMALSFLLADESYAVSILRLREGRPSPHRHWYLLGVGLTLWLGFQAATAGGVLMGAQLPSSLPLDFALPLTFIAIAVPMLRSRAAWAAALASAAVALTCAGWRYNLGMMAASLVGILVGALVARRRAT